MDINLNTQQQAKSYGQSSSIAQAPQTLQPGQAVQASKVQQLTHNTQSAQTAQTSQAAALSGASAFASHSSLTEALQGAGFKVTEENLQLVKALVENDLPVNKETITKLNQALKLLGPDEIEKAIFLLKNDLKINSGNAQILNELANGSFKLSEQLKVLTAYLESAYGGSNSSSRDGLPLSQAQSLAQTQAQSGTQNPGAELLLLSSDELEAQLSTQNQALQGSQTSQLNQSNPMNQASQSTQTTQDQSTLSTQSAQATTSAQASTQGVLSPETQQAINSSGQTNPGTYNTTQAQNSQIQAQTQTQPTFQALDQASQTTAQGLQEGKASQAMPLGQSSLEQTSQTSQALAQSTQAQQITNATTQSPSSTQGAQAAQGTQSTQANQPVPPNPIGPSANPSTVSDAEKEALKATMQESKAKDFSIKALTKQIKELGVDLNQKNPREMERVLNEVRDSIRILKDLGDPRLNPLTQKIEASLNFMEQVKTAILLQMPVLMNQQPTNAELYVFRDKRNKNKGSKTMSALVAMDTANLGRFETYIQKTENTVSLQFRLENERVVQLVRSKMEDLQKLLSESNFKLQNFSFKKLEETFTLLSSEKSLLASDEKDPDSTLRNLDFDVKA